jgi:hypothetical protein
VQQAANKRRENGDTLKKFVYIGDFPVGISLAVADDVSTMSLADCSLTGVIRLFDVAACKHCLIK